MLLHTEVKWVSTGNCLWQFYYLTDTVIEFLESTDSSLSTSVKERRMDITYLWYFWQVQQINTQLQLQKSILLRVKGYWCLYDKLGLLKRNMCRKDLPQFPAFQVFWKESKLLPGVEIYSSILNNWNKIPRFNNASCPWLDIQPFFCQCDHYRKHPTLAAWVLHRPQTQQEEPKCVHWLGYEVFWGEKSCTLCCGKKSKYCIWVSLQHTWLKKDLSSWVFKKRPKIDCK